MLRRDNIQTQMDRIIMWETQSSRRQNVLALDILVYGGNEIKNEGMGEDREIVSKKRRQWFILYVPQL